MPEWQNGADIRKALKAKEKAAAANKTKTVTVPTVSTEKKEG